MCPIGNSPDRADVVETSGASARIEVGATAVELKAGSNRLTGRQFIVIYNDSKAPIFTSPSQSVSGSGVNKGIILNPEMERVIPCGDVPVYAITLGATAQIIVQEFA